MSTTSYLILDDALEAKLQDGDRKGYLFLEDHPTLPLQWKVESFDATYLKKLGTGEDGVLTKYSTVSPFGFDAFMTKANEEGYEVVFVEDPAEQLAWLASLDDAPGIAIESDMPGTIDGFLPFQVNGINFAKGQRATYFNWSTGTGKSVGCGGVVDWYIQNDLVDLVMYFAKPHNLVNTRRGLLRKHHVPSVVIAGTPVQREKQYIEVLRRMQNPTEPAVLVTNYEKMRDDTEALVMLVEGKRVLCVWDEMSSKLGNHTTGVYKGAAEVLYTSFTTRKKTVKKGGKNIEEVERLFYPLYGQERTAEVYHLAASATPIEHNPTNWFNQVRLMDTRVYGTRKDFESKFVRTRDPWGNPEWNESRLPLIGAMATHIVHQVDKEDPDIAAQFPEVLPPEVLYLEMSKKEQWLYDALISEYEALKAQDVSILEDTEILSAINCLQLLCSNPMAVLDSAHRFQAWLDGGGDPKKRDGSEVAWKFAAAVGNDKKFDVGVPTKMQALAEIVEDDPDEKFVVFSSLNDTVIPYLSAYLDQLKISHVLYHGGLTAKQKQASEDAFQEDPSIRIFLSSDAGSDSINLHAAGEVVHYDRPWSWAKLTQRQNRINRIISTLARSRYRTLEMEGTFEGRKAEVIQVKEGFHKGIFRGDIASQARQLRRGDYLYVLLGDPSLR